MGFGDNTRALIITRGLAEITRLGTALGGRPETFAGLAGVGDLITTCTSVHSRTHQAGILIGGGMKPAEAIEKVGAVVEGYDAAATGMELAERMGIEMPITQAIYSVMYEDACVYSVSEGMMGRAKYPRSQRQLVKKQNRTKHPLLYATEGVFCVSIWLFSMPEAEGHGEEHGETEGNGGTGGLPHIEGEHQSGDAGHHRTQQSQPGILAHILGHVPSGRTRQHQQGIDDQQPHPSQGQSDYHGDSAVEQGVQQVQLALHGSLPAPDRWRSRSAG